MRYLKIFSQFKNFNVVNNGSECDLGWTPRIILAVLFLQNEKGFYICFMRRSLNFITIYHVRIYERVMASPSICIDIHGVVLFLAENHMKCVFYIFKDNLLTLSHSMIVKSLLTPSWRLMALDNRLVSSANNTSAVFLHTIQRSLI